MPVNVPHLRRKFELLYKVGRNTEILRHNQLAKALSGQANETDGIAPANIAYWIQAESIPDKRFREILLLFNFEEWIFLTDNLPLFEEYLEKTQHNTSPTGAWEKLWQRAEYVILPQ